jgi:hypothetical protein
MRICEEKSSFHLRLLSYSFSHVIASCPTFPHPPPPIFCWLVEWDSNGGYSVVNSVVVWQRSPNFPTLFFYSSTRIAYSSFSRYSLKGLCLKACVWSRQTTIIWAPSLTLQRSRLVEIRICPSDCAKGKLTLRFFMYFRLCTIPIWPHLWTANFCLCDNALPMTSEAPPPPKKRWCFVFSSHSQNVFSSSCSDWKRVYHSLAGARL